MSSHFRLFGGLRTNTYASIEFLHRVLLSRMDWSCLTGGGLVARLVKLLLEIVFEVDHVGHELANTSEYGIKLKLFSLAERVQFSLLSFIKAVLRLVEPREHSTNVDLDAHLAEVEVLCDCFSTLLQKLST